MLDPYKMVFVNLIACLIIIFGLAFYAFVLKRKINLLILLIIISIVPTISIFRNGVYESGDFTLHIYRTISFYSSLSEGNLMPSWASILNATYGFPLFIFNYTLPYYLLSFFHFLGFSFIMSMKIFLAGSFILSGIFMYIFVNALLKNKLAAFSAAIFYLFAPYHLIDLHFKITIGEILAFTILPLLFFFIIKNQKNLNVNYILLAGIAFAALVASHVFIALAAGGIIILYSLFEYGKTHNKKILVSNISSLIIGATTTLYVWLTPFFMSQYTVIHDTNLEFVPVENYATLFYSPWRLGFLFQGPEGEIAHLIGYSHIFIILFLLYEIFKNKIKNIDKNGLIFWLVILFILFFFLSPFSRFFWELVPFIKAVGQHRLLIPIVFCISILAAYFMIAYRKNHILIVTIMVITILTSILNWGNRRTIPEVGDATLIKNAPFSTYEIDRHFYALPRWTDEKTPWFEKIPESQIKILSGDGNITLEKKNSTQHIYTVEANTDLVADENTLYFPGWKAFINQTKIEITPTKNGLIRIKLPKGVYQLSITYQDISILQYFKTISLLIMSSIVFLLATSGLRKLYHYFLHNRR